MSMPPMVTGAAALPALSMQVPVADWLAPSVEIVTGFATVATPERSSVQVKLTVTFWLVQAPLVYGLPSAVVALAFTTGGVSSMLMPAWAVVAVFPARSAQAPVAD